MEVFNIFKNSCKRTDAKSASVQKINYINYISVVAIYCCHQPSVRSEQRRFHLLVCNFSLCPTSGERLCIIRNRNAFDRIDRVGCLDRSNPAVLYLIHNNRSFHTSYFLSSVYGWGEPLQLTEVSSSSIGGFSAVITDDYQIKILAAVWSFGENGAYEYADLMLLDRDLNCDLAVSDADYIRDTLVAGQAMTFTVDVTNNSGKTVQGVRVTAKNGTTELASSEFGITLLPGQTKTAYLNYTLPGTLSLTSAEITVLPTALEDLDAGDNTAECLFRSVDISIEACAAVRTDSGIQILAQVVNRGSSASESFEVVFHQSGSEGVELGRQGVEPLAPGELKNVILTLDKALAEGEMVCVTAEPQENENLLGNNSAYATVRSIFTQTIDMTAAGVYEDGKLTVRVSVNNQTKAAKDLRIMVAAYAEDGRMIGVSLAVM